MYIRKLFTRADKRALRELYKATNGFRQIPKGIENLNARDVYRFKDIADQSVKGFKNIDKDQAKYLLNKAGLQHTSSDLDHLIKKYNDPKLIARYRRMFKHKNPDIVKVNKQADRINQIYNRAVNIKSGKLDRQITKLNKKSDDTWDQAERIKELLKGKYKKKYNVQEMH